MPAPRNLLAAAPELAPDDPQSLVAFACTPEWLEAEPPSAPPSVDAPAAAQPPAAPQVPLPRFSMVAYTGGPMRIAGWRHPVVVDLAGLSVPSQRRPIRLGHDASLGVGHTDAIRIDGGKLIASGVVSRDTAAAREVVASSRNGFPWQASIGSSVDEHEFVRDNQTVQVNGRTWPGPLNVVRRATLGEISFVDLGADGNTSALVTASTPSSTALGDPPVKTTPVTTPDPTTPPITAVAEVISVPATAPAVPTAVPAASTTIEASHQNESTVQLLRATAVAEIERITAVRTLCASAHPTIEAKAIKDGWDTTRTELEVLRASRPQAPAIHVRDSRVNSEILEAACLLSTNRTDAERVCSEAALEAASTRFHGGIGLQELLLEAAWANGYTGRSFRDTHEVLRAAFPHSGTPGQVRAEGGLSTIDIGGILSNLANKFLLVTCNVANISSVLVDFSTIKKSFFSTCGLVLSPP